MEHEIDNEMASLMKEAEISAQFLAQNAPKQSIEKKSHLTQMLEEQEEFLTASIASIEKEFGQDRDFTNGKPRNFFRNTCLKNSRSDDMLTSFSTRHQNSTTGQIMDEYKKLGNDPIAMNNMSSAADCAYRNMILTHKTEERSALPENLDEIKATHSLETAYFNYSEQKYAGKTPDTNELEKAITGYMKLKPQVKEELAVKPLVKTVAPSVMKHAEPNKFDDFQKKVIQRMSPQTRIVQMREKFNMGRQN